MSLISYELKRFKRSRDPEFLAALLLYTRNTSANIRTDSNEIAYWLTNFRKKYRDDFYVFGFYRNKELVGYAEAAYFYEEKLYALDYIVIDAANRGNNVFYEFVDHLRRYFESEHPDFRYAVAEVPYGSGHEHPTKESQLAVRLLKLQGFKVIRAPYHHPRLMLNDFESEMRSDLLVFASSELERMGRETYLAIVHALYYKYYLRWKTVRPGTEAEYKKHLDHLFDRIRSGLSDKKNVIVNGHNLILPSPAGKPVFSMHRIISFSIQSLLVVILLTAAMLGLKSAFNLSDYLFAAVFILAMGSFVTVAGIVSKDAREVLSQLIDLAKFVWYRRLDDSKPSVKEPENSSPTGQLKP